MGKIFFNGQGLKLRHPTEWNWGRRRGKPWTCSDEECARFLRHCGLTDKDIAEILGRTVASVIGKIGYVGKQPYVKHYETLRPAMAKTWGDIADNMPCAGAA